MAPFRSDQGVGECVDGLGRVRDHPLLVIRRQVIAEAYAQLVEQFEDLHPLRLARLGRPGIEPHLRAAEERGGTAVVDCHHVHRLRGSLNAAVMGQPQLRCRVQGVGEHQRD